NLAEEMRQLVELLASSQVTAHQAVLLHLDVLGEMIEGLGHRSARHVMNRADILILEMMVCLVEGYRTRLWEQLHPPQQQQLPGFGHELELSSGQR
ncbi:MAG: hypothetical protein QGF59_26170, partial [Pirellulaceae bacterium]|nr:hypothetical protein [Pirellulaceae bacterium]